MIDVIPPFAIFIFGAALIPFLKGKAKKAYVVAIPLLAMIDLALIKPQTSYILDFFGFELILLQSDRLSWVIAFIFIMIGFLAIVYSLKEEESDRYIFPFLYIGSSLGVVFAGDFFTLFVFWEIMAVTSAMLIWQQKEKRSVDAGFRYILMHVFGGCCLLGGIVLHYMSTGSIAVGTVTSGLAWTLVLIGFGLNTAFVGIHTWLPDSYPKATITGAVFMSVYTTKTGVYVLARNYPGGVDVIAYMGGCMVLYGVIFALLQNDARKLLSYHIVSQVGYMVAGVGIGTWMGVNGGIGHVFNHILYKALLFMCMGAVIYGTGRRHLTELGGGLWRKMPVTMICCMIAAFSISGLPGFNGFVSKGMVIAAAAEKHMTLLELALILGSVGTFLSFLKLTYFVFFRENEEYEAKEVPLPMQIAMGSTAFLCVLFGVYPQLLFNILPYPVVGYHTYSLEHVAATTQLLMMTAVVFFLVNRLYQPHKFIAWDVDYFYRKFGRGTIWFFNNPLANFGLLTEKVFFDKLPNFILWFTRNPLAALAITKDTVKSWGVEVKGLRERRRAYPNIPMRMEVVSSTVLLTVIFLSVYLLFLLLGGAKP